MRVWHVTEYCHASGFGGTERYILELVRALEPLGWESVIGWLTADRALRPFTLEGARIVPLGASVSRVDPPDRTFVPHVARLLSENGMPELIHFHTFGQAEAAVARLATERGIPTVFTYHTPALSCRRETLLRWGHTVCDGQVRTLRCSACKLQERLGGAPALAWIGMALSLVPAFVLGPLAAGKWRRRSAFVQDTAAFRNSFRAFLDECAIVVSCCRWSLPLLRANGARPDRLALCPQGVPMAFVEGLRRLPPRSPSQTVDGRNAFLVGYVGRLAPNKGIHLLVEAFVRAPYPQARLRIYGWSPDDSVRHYTHQVMQTAARDPRVTFLPRLPFHRMVEEYTRLSLVAIPSVSLETGPFVLLEALQAGVPVWGTDRVGQLDLLRERGRVIAPNTVGAWQAALQEAFRLHERGQWLPAAPGARPPVRTMADVASEMTGLYARARESVAEGGASGRPE